jgi:hypothetical protein
LLRSGARKRGLFGWRADGANHGRTGSSSA